VSQKAAERDRRSRTLSYEKGLADIGHICRIKDNRLVKQMTSAATNGKGYKEDQRADGVMTSVAGAISAAFLQLCVSLLIEQNARRKFTKSLDSMGNKIL